MNREKVVTLAVIAVAWGVIFATYEHVVLSDQAWHDEGYGALQQKAWSDWKAHHPYGDNQVQDFINQTPNLADPNHDPRNVNSFWEAPYSRYVLVVPAFVWLGLLFYFSFPETAVLPVTAARRMMAWGAAIDKDDWLKIALIASILLAAAIIAAATHIQPGE